MIKSKSVQRSYLKVVGAIAIVESIATAFVIVWRKEYGVVKIILVLMLLLVAEVCFKRASELEKKCNK